MNTKQWNAMVHMDDPYHYIDQGEFEYDHWKEQLPYEKNSLSPDELADLEEELEAQQEQIFDRAMKLKKAIALWKLLDELRGAK